MRIMRSFTQFGITFPRQQIVGSTPPRPFFSFFVFVYH
jgi:hypothetical protein